MMSLIGGAIEAALPDEISATRRARWQDVIVKALAFRRENRFPSARDFALALRTAPLGIDVPAAREQLASFLQSRFVSRRQSIREAIERGLRERRTQSDVARVESASALQPSRIVTNDSLSLPTMAAAHGNGELASSLSDSARASRGSTSRSGKWIGAAAGVGLAVAATIIAARGARGARDAADPMTGSSAAPGAAAAPLAASLQIPTSEEPAPITAPPPSASAVPGRASAAISGRPPAWVVRPKPVPTASTLPEASPAPLVPSATASAAPSTSARGGRHIDRDNPFRAPQ